VGAHIPIISPDRHAQAAYFAAAGFVGAGGMRTEDRSNELTRVIDREVNDAGSSGWVM